jgi:Ser-tRNA(Ala) deacylase AlaX
MGGSDGRYSYLPGRYVLPNPDYSKDEGLMKGGGQPTDTGHLSTLDPNGGIQKTYVVEGCLRRKLTAVHLVRLGEGEGLEAGAEVELTIDWDRRADHVGFISGGRG